MIICTIDPGIRNFAIYVEEFDEDILKRGASRIKSATKRCEQGKKEKKKRKGRIISHEFLDVIYAEGKTLLSEVVDLIPNMPVKKNLHLAKCRLMIFLNDNRDILDRCDAFFCERQLRLNPSAQSIEQCCYAFFAMTYLDNRVVSSVGANRKYQFLDCKKGMTKIQRKKWSPLIAEEIMKKRDERYMIEKLNCLSKRDDIGDTIIIAQSIKYSIFFEGTI